MRELSTYRTPHGFNFARACFSFADETAYAASCAAKRGGWTPTAKSERAAATTKQWLENRESLIAAKATGWTPEKRAMQSERTRLSHTRSEVKAAHAAAEEKRVAALRASHTEERKQKQSEIQKALWAAPEKRAARIASMTTGWTVEARARQSASIKAMWARRKEARTC
jgi:hypothetical protein